MDQKIKMLFTDGEVKGADKYIKQMFNFAYNQRKEKLITMSCHILY